MLSFRWKKQTIFRLRKFHTIRWWQPRLIIRRGKTFKINSAVGVYFKVWNPIDCPQTCKFFKYLQDGGEAGGSSNLSSPLNQTSLTFMGFNITTMTGVQVYKTVITLLPLVPILVLLVQNTLYVNDLLAQQTSISSTESQVTWINYLLLGWVNLMPFDYAPSYNGILFVFR